MSPKSASEYSAEEAEHELFARFSHDVTQCIEAFEYIGSEGTKISQKYWLDFFEANLNLATEMQRLFGENGLDFGDSAHFYAEFDSRNARSAHVLTVHPKERQFRVPSLETEVCEYVKVILSLKDEVAELLKSFQRELDAKLRAVLVHIKHIQARLKLRDTFHKDWVKLQSKEKKLQKKNEKADSKLSASELAEATANLASASARLNALSTKLRTTLPESMSLLEEFVESLVKWAVCRNHEIAGVVSRALHTFGQNHGFLDPTSNRHVPDLGLIIDQWEASATTTRLRIESLLMHRYSADAELLDSEIPKHVKSSGLTKAWSKITHKNSEKRHEVRPFNREAGIFHDHQVADPISSYIRFHTPNTDSAEQLRPLQKIPLPVSNTATVAPNQIRKVPPPLPPRDSVASSRMLPPKELPKTPPLQSSGAFTPSPLPSNIGKSPLYSSPLSLVADERETVNSSVMEEDSDSAPTNSFSDLAHEKLAKLYNGQKNEIKEAPVLPSKIPSIMNDWRPTSEFLTNSANPSTTKLLKLHEFYDQVLQANSGSPKRILTAVQDFKGEQIEDLSFKENDRIEVLFDLQQNVMTYNKQGGNWFLGATVGDSRGRRMGYVPSTYFEKK